MASVKNNPWTPILRKLKLSKSEAAIVRRYEENPEGKSFLPVADILKSHQKMDECLELLMEGVERHPGFTVARVILARELMGRGLMQQAWTTLENSPESLHENVMAQKIGFKLAIVLGKEKEAREVFQHIKSRQFFDDEIKKLGDALEFSRFIKVREELIEQLKAAGVAVLVDSSNDEVSSSADSQFAELIDTGAGQEQPQDLKFLKAIEGFYVVPLREIFSGERIRTAPQVGAGVELDSTTLADIFEKQGHYQKALDIYRRLLQASPHNELYKKKVVDINRLKREQRERDLAINPEVVDQMETLEILDHQIKYLYRLLERLA